ncbi:hypothetical protein QA646_29060 (plasmid) [Rhizobium sp. CB3090]|uniref:hypothetical protein n=1 Tax=Rhizobium sp. CB3090 TaxID=3039156 RepID=UPI0024B0BB70|nr:hypothetical protein [Rhizobium sp. CB3090]WFU12931.1 hypothetical protein QA646_29060 [Rhizobium sp. CB3090]
MSLDAEQLHWLLDGIDLDAMVRHPVRQYEFVGSILGANAGSLLSANQQSSIIISKCERTSRRRASATGAWFGGQTEPQTRGNIPVKIAAHRMMVRMSALNGCEPLARSSRAPLH